MKLPIRIQVRTDVDWGSLTPERFVLQQEPGQPQRFIKWAHTLGLQQTWSKAFSMPFFEFRRHLQSLAQSNLESVRNARISTGLAQVDSWLNAEEDELIFPVDDDDWFSPDLCELAEVSPDTAVVTWPPAQLIYHPESRRPVLYRLPSKALMTNNWGIRKSFLRQHFNRDATLRILSRHAEATYEVSVAFGNRQELLPPKFTAVGIEGPRVKSYPLSAGLALKHFGALSILVPALRKDNPLAELRSLDFESPVRIQPWVAWAEPWVRRYEELARQCR